MPAEMTKKITIEDDTGRRLVVSVPASWDNFYVWRYPGWMLGPDPTPDEYAEIISIDDGSAHAV